MNTLRHDMRSVPDDWSSPLSPCLLCASLQSPDGDCLCLDEVICSQCPHLGVDSIAYARFFWEQP